MALDWKKIGDAAKALGKEVATQIGENISQETKDAASQLFEKVTPTQETKDALGVLGRNIGTGAVELVKKERELEEQLVDKLDEKFETLKERISKRPEKTQTPQNEVTPEGPQ